MSLWTAGQLAEAARGRLVAGRSDQLVGPLCLDSRRVERGDTFLAIVGPRFDAHTFLPDVLRRGAAALVVSRLPDLLPPVPTILVEDTVRALGEIAATHRQRFAIPVIAVTGSCGKTTTKEFIAQLLSRFRRVLKTEGTQNNHIGLPLTLLKLSSEHEVAVVELGSNHPGEIAYLAAMARPTIAVITNIGPAHLEFFGSLEGVRQEKLSLLEALRPGGLAIVPGDQLDVLLGAKTRLHPEISLLTFGTSDQCGVQAIEIRRAGACAYLQLRDLPGEFCISVPGAHNVENALAALATAKALGFDLATVQDRLHDCVTLPMRSELVHRNGITVLNDCYNANPLSFARALETLRGLDVQRRVVVAGDMLELGSYAPVAHQAIGRLAAQCGADYIFSVGRFASEVARGACEARHPGARAFDSVPEVLHQLSSLLREGDGVLIKGSRNLHLEQVTAFVLEQQPRCGTANLPPPAAA